MSRVTIPILFGLLAACSAEQQPSAPASEGAGLATASQAAVRTTIPEQLHGRWGLVPPDCTSTRGDAKGLLVIDATSLKFYESVGKLANIAEAGETKIRANFDFTGEGMAWRLEETLELRDETLVRREAGQEAAPEPFNYTRCQVK